MIITKLKKAKVDRTASLFTDTIDALGDDYAHIASQEKALAASKKNTVERIFKLVDKAPRVGKRQTSIGKRWEVGKLFRSSDVLDSQRLRKLVGPDIWKEITVVERKIDPVLLENAITNGKISVKLYSKCVSKEENPKPSIYVKPAKQ